MAFTRNKLYVSLLVGLTVLAGAVACDGSSGSSKTSKVTAGKDFWKWITPQASAIHVPESVDDIAKRASTIVIAHVTGVVDGRRDKACDEVAPGGQECSIPKTVFVQLTVDRPVYGPVVKGQVLNMEMYRPPSPLTIDSIRQNMPQDELLFFLAKSPQDVDVWGPVSYSRAIIAQNADGIYTPLPPHDGNPGPFLLSFQADTVAQAADKAAQARSRR